MKNFLNRIQIFPNMSKNQGNTKKRTSLDRQSHICVHSFSRDFGLMSRSLYSCLKPAYLKGWDSVTSLTDTARDELIFWESNIANLNRFAIATCELVAEDASGEELYAAKFSDKNETIYSRKLTTKEKNESSSFRECLVILGIYTNPSSPINKFQKTANIASY